MVRYERVDGVLHQVVEGRAMLISPEGKEVVVLNATGTAAWDALADGGDPTALVAAVAATHPDVPVETITADVGAFLDELVDAGLVRVG